MRPMLLVHFPSGSYYRERRMLIQPHLLMKMGAVQTSLSYPAETGKENQLQTYIIPSR